MQQSQGGLVLKMIKIFILLSVLLPSLWGQGYTIPVAGNTNANIPSYICTPAGANTTTYTCSPSPSPSSYTSGMILAFKPDVTNTGSSTVNVNGLGAKTIQKIVSGTLTNLDSGDLDSDGVYLLRYNGTVFITDSDSSISGITVKVDGSSVGTEATLDFLSSSGVNCIGTDVGTDITLECSIDTSVILSRATHQAGTDLYCNSSNASGTTYTCSLTPTLSAYTTGMLIVWNRSQLCTGGTTTTLNIDALGAKNIKKTDGTTDPAAGDCTANQRVLLVYDGTLFRLVGGGEGGGSTPTATTSAWFPFSAGINMGAFTGIGTVSADVVRYWEFTTPFRVTVEKLTFYAINAAPGNLTWGIYDSSCNKVVQSTAAAGTQNDMNTLTLSAPTTLEANTIYFLALSSDAGTFSVVPGAGGDGTNNTYNSCGALNAGRSSPACFTGSNSVSSGTMPAACGTKSSFNYQHIYAAFK